MAKEEKAVTIRIRSWIKAYKQGENDPTEYRENIMYPIDEFDFYEEVKKKTIFDNKKVRSGIKFFIQIAVTMFLAWLVALGFCYSITVQDNSMEPTVMAGQTFFVNRAIYKVSSPKRGDIVAFRKGKNKSSGTYVKRIIGLPGETIEIKEGQILIDGKTYIEKKSFPAMSNGGLAEESVTLRKDEYFVLGDNRNSSEDSRFRDMGNIKKENIIGKLWFISKPWKEIGFLKG